MSLIQLSCAHNQPCNDNLTCELPTGRLSIVHQKGTPLQEIADFASRYNNKRHFLIASKLIGKYVPARPSVIRDAQRTMATLPNLFNCPTLFVGFAESCSGFGEGVFDEILSQQKMLRTQSMYIHTTRQFCSATQDVAIAFKEEHSHAVNQVILNPLDKTQSEIFNTASTVVLIEDEITTGKTIKNFLNEYVSTINNKLKRVVILTLLDIRKTSDKMELGLAFPDLQILSYSMCSSSLQFYKSRDNDVFKQKNSYQHSELNVPLINGRGGLMANDCRRDEAIALSIMNSISADTPITVIGTSEYTAMPRKVGVILESHGYDVEMLSTTRAPLKIGNAIKTKMTFTSHYGDGVEHYLYNFNTNRQAIFFYESKEQSDMHQSLHASLKAMTFFGE